MEVKPRSAKRLTDQMMHQLPEQVALEALADISA